MSNVMIGPRGGPSVAVVSVALLTTFVLNGCGDETAPVQVEILEESIAEEALGTDPPVPSWSYSVQANAQINVANTTFPVDMPLSPMPLPGVMQEVGYSWSANATPTGGWGVRLCDASTVPESCLEVGAAAGGITRVFVGHSAQAQMRFQFVAYGSLPVDRFQPRIPTVTATVTVVNTPNVVPLTHQYAMSRIGPNLGRGLVWYTQTLPREQLPPDSATIRSVRYAWRTSYIHPAMTVQFCGVAGPTTICTDVTGAQAGTTALFNGFSAANTVFSYRFYVNDPTLGALVKIGPRTPVPLGGLNMVDVTY